MRKYQYDALRFEKSKLDNNKLYQGLQEMKWGLWECVEQMVREKYPLLIEGLLECERDEIIDERRSQGSAREWCYRNGSTVLHIQTRVGVIEVRRPQLRKAYASRVLPQHENKEGMLLDLVEDLYTMGISTRKMELALGSILKSSLSAGSVSRITNRVCEKMAAFHRRPITDEYVYLYMDGVPLKVKESQGEEKKGYLALTIYGVTQSGKKEIIDFHLSRSESEDNWAGFLFDVYERGLKGVKAKLVITDGAKGLHKAIAQVYPRLLRQRCWVHKIRNVSLYIGANDKAACLSDLKEIYAADNRQAALRAFKEWESTWESFYPKAVHCVKKDLGELLNFYFFPKSHWKKIRTTNPIERTFREVKRRTKVMDNYLPSMKSCEKIFYVITMFLNKRWATKKMLQFPKIVNMPGYLPAPEAA